MMVVLMVALKVANWVVYLVVLSVVWLVEMSVVEMVDALVESRVEGWVVLTVAMWAALMVVQWAVMRDESRAGRMVVRLEEMLVGESVDQKDIEKVVLLVV